VSDVTLVLGGVRSGKSAFAEQLAMAAGPRVLYVATAVPADAEMEERIRRHRARRPAGWGLMEEPVDLARVLETCQVWDAVLLESVSGWLGNLILQSLPALEPRDGREDRGPRAGTGSSAAVGRGAELPATLEREATKAVDALLARQRECRAPLIAVSDEAGLSLVPPNDAGRMFQDLLGTVNQALAAAADRVYLVVAGLPIQLKGTPESSRAAPPPDRDDSLRR
jgi:adenosylcobinamide kinase/adenosylcobinamide-phosphate guanylyltransferase